MSIRALKARGEPRSGGAAAASPSPGGRGWSPKEGRIGEVRSVRQRPGLYESSGAEAGKPLGRGGFWPLYRIACQTREAATNSKGLVAGTTRPFLSAENIGVAEGATLPTVPGKIVGRQAARLE